MHSFVFRTNAFFGFRIHARRMVAKMRVRRYYGEPLFNGQLGNLEMFDNSRR